MDRRISFSNDFVEIEQPLKLENMMYREAPVSSEFEFSVKDRYCMIAADEIFCQGRLLPLKDSSRNLLVKTTLRDKLMQVNEDDEDVSFPKLTKTSSICWKQRFGFKRSHFVSNKQHRSEGVLKTVEEEEKSSVFLHEDLINIATKNGNCYKKAN